MNLPSISSATQQCLRPAWLWTLFGLPARLTLATLLLLTLWLLLSELQIQYTSVCLPFSSLSPQRSLHSVLLHQPSCFTFTQRRILPASLPSQSPHTSRRLSSAFSLYLLLSLSPLTPSFLWSACNKSIFILRKLIWVCI